MIQPARNPDKINDDSFAAIIKPAYDEIKNYLNNEVIYDFFAFCIAAYYKNNAIWEDHTLELEYKDAIDYFSTISDFSNLDIAKLKKILKEKHSLILTSANPIGLKKI